MATIELSHMDDCFTRARKMCEFAGFNPREGATPLIGYFAEILMKYMELDKKAYDNVFSPKKLYKK